jgi:hypothetical protein
MPLMDRGSKGYARKVSLQIVILSEAKNLLAT